jgi:hypothetical protein
MARGTTGNAATDTGSRRSRRELMAGAAGALGVATIGALGRATPALAGTDGDVVLGALNQSTLRTTIELTSSTDIAFVGQADSGGIGVVGSCNGGTGSNVGVRGDVDNGDAVFGIADVTGNGVHGLFQGPTTSGFGVFGEHTQGGVAIQGNSLTASSISTGVLGLGKTGVYGLTTSGGTGVRASEAFDGTGVALQVVGPATFTRSGISSIAAGKTSKTVTGVPLTALSLVLATVQNNAGVSVAFVVPSVSGSSFSINLNKAVPVGKTAKVGWFVVN